jgi:hypothetical protein
MKTLLMAAMLALVALTALVPSDPAAADRLPEPFATAEREGI